MSRSFPVEKGAEVIVRMATLGKNGPTGTFQENESELAWYPARAARRPWFHDRCARRAHRCAL